MANIVRREYLEYRILQGDTWDYVAWRMYGDESLIEILTTANPHIPLTPFLPMGVVMAVPIIETPRPSLNNSQRPPWRQK